MNENKWLTGILIALAISVLATSGLIAYLTLSRAQERNAASETLTAEQAELENALTAQPEAAAIPAEPRIAFVSDREGDIAVYTLLPDGADPQRASTSDYEICIAPTWSPDGARLAYVAAQRWPSDSVDRWPTNADDVPVSVWVSAANGSEHIQISHGISNTDFVPPTWSPDGARLAFVSADETAGEEAVHIHIAWSDGSGIERSIAFPRPIQLLLWSPTQDELLIVSGDVNRDSMIVHVLAADGSEITQVFQNSVTADWTPDGESVVVGDITSQEILIIDPHDAEQTPRVIAQTALQPIEIAFSPSGDHVAVAASGHYRQGYATVLHVITVESGEIAAVAEGDGWVLWPAWSPDGQSLVFTWGELARTPGLPIADVWLYDVASGRAEALTTYESFEGDTAWSP